MEWLGKKTFPGWNFSEKRSGPLFDEALCFKTTQSFWGSNLLACSLSCQIYFIDRFYRLWEFWWGVFGEVTTLAKRGFYWLWHNYLVRGSGLGTNFDFLSSGLRSDSLFYRHLPKWYRRFNQSKFYCCHFGSFATICWDCFTLIDKTHRKSCFGNLYHRRILTLFENHSFSCCCSAQPLASWINLTYCFSSLCPIIVCPSTIWDFDSLLSYLVNSPISYLRSPHFRNSDSKAFIVSSLTDYLSSLIDCYFEERILFAYVLFCHLGFKCSFKLTNWFELLYTDWPFEWNP